MVNHTVGAGHYKYPLIPQLLQRHVQGTDRHGGGDGDLLGRHAAGNGINLLFVQCRQRKSVADSQLAF